MTQQASNLSLLYQTAIMYCREVDKLAWDLETDGSYLVCCVHVGPKLQALQLATEKLIKALELFEVETASDVEEKCSDLIAVLKQGANPLLKRMSQEASLIAAEEEKMYEALVEEGQDWAKFRDKIVPEYPQFCKAQEEIRRLLNALEAMDHGLKKIKPNLAWIPFEMAY